MRYEGIEGRVAIVTGANHGIGAATAERGRRRARAAELPAGRDPADLAPRGLPLEPGARRSVVVRSIREAGGQAEAIEADLRDPATPATLFDAAEAAFGPVDILVNNATGWRQDTFKPAERDRLGRPLQACRRRPRARCSRSMREARR